MFKYSHAFLYTIKAKLILVVLLTLLADWLFYNQPLGCNVPLFASATLAVICMLHPSALRSKSGQLLLVCLVSLILSLLYSPRLLPIIIFTIGVITLLMIKKYNSFPTALTWIRNLIIFIKRVTQGWYKDYNQIQLVTQHRFIPKSNMLRLLSYIIIPTILTVIFCWLFAKANPILANLLRHFNWADLISLLTIRRAIFWLMLPPVLWTFIRPRFITCHRQMPQFEQVDISRLVTVKSIIFSLLLFNVLFAIQNIMDISFLWGGQMLPTGMSYATYARAGAYPLIVTVLLAAAYILIVFSDNQQYHTRLTSKLALVWIAQNFILTISAIYRTILYIEAYSLTLLRITGLLWMALISAGLILVIIKIQFKKTNTWLINGNMLAAALLTYTCCFVNFNSIIADYNLQKAIGQTTIGTNLDVQYMASLGIDALSALRKVPTNSHILLSAPSKQEMLRCELLVLECPQLAIKNMRTHFENQLAIKADSNWRAWTGQQFILLQSKPLLPDTK